MNSKEKFMVIVLQYPEKDEETVSKTLSDLKKKVSELNLAYQGSDERIIKAVKNNLANVE